MVRTIIGAPRKTGKAGDFFAMIKWNECLYGDYPTPTQITLVAAYDQQRSIIL